MIRLTRLNHGLFMLNPDLIEHLEMTPDTVITLTNGHQFMVRESGEEVVERIVEFRRSVGANCLIARISEPQRTGGEEA
ncbi:MAG: flagellar FlbD family protein [Bryobacteraceae bacterium]